MRYVRDIVQAENWEFYIAVLWLRLSPLGPFVGHTDCEHEWIWCWAPAESCQGHVVQGPW